MPDDAGEFTQNSVRRPEVLRPLLYGGLGLVGVAGLGAASQYGIDGGTLKFFWAGLQTASPMMSTASVIALVIVWANWQRDRDKHERRTIDYIAGMNTAARLREADMTEKAQLRAKIEQMRRPRSRGRR